ncbi:MAG TPA: beta/gamma crystallin-related protein [Caldimonas sp.]
MNAGRTLRTTAIAVFGCVAAMLAGAAEITLYEHPGFAGGQLTLRGYTPNIANTGFNDKASSIVVASGRWEVCTDADFKGTCVTLTRGEYPALDRRLNDRISSARETGSFGENRGSYNDYGRGAIELFAQPDFRGPSLRLDRDSAALDASGFNDRASSVIVGSGTWELCSDNGFGGNCRTYAPGRYADLGYGMARQLSSVRHTQ